MQERIDRVLARFADADRASERLQREARVGCPPGCGACCLAPEIEATPAELRPLARELAAQGRAQALLERVERQIAAREPRCVLYAPEPGSDGARGRCGEYAFRPLVCRLFGFAARRERDGTAELVACPTMRAADPEGVARAERHVRAGGDVAFFGDASHALAAELPGEGTQRVPINEALARALRAALLWHALDAAQRGDGEPSAGRSRPAP